MIISRTPFRLSLAGGGTDLDSYYKTGYGQVLSTTIDQYMYITVNRRFDDSLRVSYSVTEQVDHADQVRHPIVRAALKRLGIDHGLEIISMADIPAGTGLGSSSSFTVGLLNALYAYTGVSVSAERLAREACEIEIHDLGEPIGKQDQYAAAYGGLNVIRFNADESVFVNPVICTPETKQRLNDCLMMFYTGRTRSASDILKQHRTRAAVNIPRLSAMRDLSDRAAEALTDGRDLARIGAILNEGWELKRGVAEKISDDEIDRLYATARDAGALGGKIAGAGGGGFLFLYVEPENQQAVRVALSLREVAFNLEPQGSKIIYVGGDCG
jgi:D-glycero-alpha-D-manno-heptose-7-phosphate kinase